MMGPVHGFEDQRVNCVVLGEQHRVIGEASAAQTVLIQNLDLVLILVR